MRYMIQFSILMLYAKYQKAGLCGSREKCDRNFLWWWRWHKTTSLYVASTKAGRCHKNTLNPFCSTNLYSITIIKKNTIQPFTWYTTCARKQIWLYQHSGIRSWQDTNWFSLFCSKHALCIQKGYCNIESHNFTITLCLVCWN